MRTSSRAVVRPMNEVELETMRQFFGAYFHQDWADDARDPDAVVSRYIEDGRTPRELTYVSQLVERFAAGSQDDSELENRLRTELWCYYLPSADGMETRTWLHHVAAMLEAGALRFRSLPPRDCFEFTSGPEMHAATVVVDASITSAEVLLDTLERGLGFPDYFGRNWNALIDCLSDMSWLGNREAVIVHPSLPTLPAHDLQMYLECLAAVADRVSRSNVPRLRFVFREDVRDRIAIAIRAMAVEKPESP